MSNQQYLSADYWNNRYLEHNTPWDIGQASPPLKKYLDNLSDKTLRILIPGAGSAYEAIYAHQQGFSNVFVCDWASTAFFNLKRQAPDFPDNHLLIEDFFKLELQVDLVLEQTFFSAIDPSQRNEYARKVIELLSSEGKLAGLLFAHPFEQQSPPFGGTKESYQRIFSPYFHILQMKISEDSVKPRAGRELFIELQKQS